MTRPAIHTRPHFDGVHWLLTPGDRKAASWLKRHRPADTIQHHGNPYPITILRGSQLIELIQLARAAKIHLRS